LYRPSPPRRRRRMTRSASTSWRPPWPEPISNRFRRGAPRTPRSRTGSTASSRPPPPATRRPTMSDRPDVTNTVLAGPRARSTDVGDVPDALRRRYLTEAGRYGGGVAYYVDATI